jgi:hypothetical protein
VDDDTGSRVTKVATMTARIERWENETKREEEIVHLKPDGPAGEFTFEHTFVHEGTYRPRLASVEHGLGYDDLPPFKVTVLTARLADADEPARESPGLAGPALLLLLVSVGHARRR